MTAENNQQTVQKMGNMNANQAQYADVATITEKVKEIIAEMCRVDRNNILPMSKIVDDLGADSLDLIEIVLALEAHFGCDIKDAEAEKITTVQDAVNHIAKCLSVNA